MCRDDAEKQARGKQDSELFIFALHGPDRAYCVRARARVHVLVCVHTTCADLWWPERTSESLDAQNRA